MKQIIEVQREGREGREPSKIVVGNVITSLKSFLPERRTIVITDANVHRHNKSFIGAWEYILAPMGEASKTLSTVEMLYRELIALGADRNTFILGIGGGIVTDMAGFVASTYMRGLDFGFIATSLLAQVDASIGGKNGVNVDGFKNMAGTFNQPDFVLCDTEMLRTLPEKEMRAGMAEIIKAAIIADPSLFDLIENHDFAQLASSEELLGQIIASAIEVKKAIVEADERETGQRRLLNLGHTFAHAIEKSSNKYNHGEAVAIGLAMGCDLSVRMGILTSAESGRIKSVVERMGLPLASALDPKQLVKAAVSDKKREGDNINMVLIHRIGRCTIEAIPISRLLELY